MSRFFILVKWNEKFSVVTRKAKKERFFYMRQWLKNNFQGITFGTGAIAQHIGCLWTLGNSRSFPISLYGLRASSGVIPECKARSNPWTLPRKTSKIWQKQKQKYKKQPLIPEIEDSSEFPALIGSKLVNTVSLQAY